MAYWPPHGAAETRLNKQEHPSLPPSGISLDPLFPRLFAFPGPFVPTNNVPAISPFAFLPPPLFCVMGCFITAHSFA